MKFSAVNFANLRRLYINQLQISLSAGEQMVDKLPAMIGQVGDEQLKQTLQSHLQEASSQIARLKQILRRKVGEAIPIQCKVLTALVEEAEEMIKMSSDESVRDASIIAAAQRFEHYEIAVYKTLKHFAQILNEEAEAELMDRTINEEGQTDQLLSEIAKRVNPYEHRAS